MSALSKSKVDRAGARLRDWFRSDPDVSAFDTDPRLSEAADVLVAWRGTHRYPLLRVQLDVGRAVQQEDPAVVPTGRRKRAGAIIYKLVRFPSMRLSQMEDIAGCRATLQGQDQVERALEQLLARRPGATLIDYVDRPKPGGYRAKHLIVVEGERNVEVQLRTVRQNRWADEVEDAAGRLDYPLKEGRGPSELVEYFDVAAAILAAEDQGKEPDGDLNNRLAALRSQVRPYFQRRSDGP